MEHRIKTVYLVHHSNTDIGYTDLQERVVEAQTDYIRTAVSLLQDPANRDFRWNCETLFCVEQFFKNAAEEEKTAGAEADETALKLAEAEKKLEAAEKQSAEYLDMAQRLQAEFDNYRRRTNTVRADAWEDGARETISLMLPVLDNLERAIGAAGEAESALKSGVELVLRQMLEILDKRGVTVIASTIPSPTHVTGSKPNTRHWSISRIKRTASFISWPHLASASFTMAAVSRI